MECPYILNQLIMPKVIIFNLLSTTNNLPRHP